MAKKVKLCTNCGNVEEGKVGGSLILTLILLLFWIIPGLIYEVWRTSEKQLQCKKCHSKGLIPKDSVVAQKFIKDNT